MTVLPFEPRPKPEPPMCEGEARCKASPSPWMTSKAIREQVSERMGRAVPKTSISPKLSELKAKGRIVRDDLLVALPERAAQTGERSLFGEGS